MQHSQIKFENFPVHTYNNPDFELYKYWNKKNKVIQNPVVYRRCTPSCYFDLADEDTEAKQCLICFNSFQGGEKVFDIGFKSVLVSYGKRLERQNPLYIKINPVTKKVIIPSVQRSVEGELAFLIFKENYQQFILAAKIAAKDKRLNLEKIQKQLKECFKKMNGGEVQKTQNSVFSFCRRPKRTDGTSQILLFFSENPHEPVPYIIQWRDQDGSLLSFERLKKLNDNFNHNTTISMIQSQAGNQLVLSISTNTFQIFVSSLNPKNQCVNHQERTLKFILVKDYGKKRDYPCQFTDHNRNKIYIIGGFEMSTETDRSEIRIDGIEWTQSGKMMKPTLTDQVTPSIFPSQIQNVEYNKNVRKIHYYPIFRGHSIINYPKFENIDKKRKAIAEANKQQNPTLKFLCLGGQRLKQEVDRNSTSPLLKVSIQQPGHKSIVYQPKIKHQVNPVTQIGAINYSANMSSIYPIQCDYPMTGHTKDNKIYNRSFVLKNNLTGKSHSEILQAYILKHQGQSIQAGKILETSKSQRVKQILQNGDNFFTLLYGQGLNYVNDSKGQFYLRANICLKKPLKSLNKGEARLVQYCTMEYYYYRNNMQIFLKEGYVSENMHN